LLVEGQFNPDSRDKYQISLVLNSTS